MLVQYSHVPERAEMTKSKLKRKFFTVVLPVAAGVFTLLFAAACCNVRKRMGELPDEAEIRRRAAQR